MSVHRKPDIDCKGCGDLSHKLRKPEDYRASCGEHVAIGSQCEWNPKHGTPKYYGEQCFNKEEFLVGAKGNYRLCGSCAALPRFKRFKKEELVT